MAITRPAEPVLEGSDTARPLSASQNQNTPDRPSESTVSLTICHPATFGTNRYRTKHVIFADGQTTLYTIQQNRNRSGDYDAKPHILIYVPKDGIPTPSTSEPSEVSSLSTTMNQYGSIDLDTLVVTLQNMLPIHLKPSLNLHKSVTTRWVTYSFESAALPGRILTWEDALFGNLICHDQDGARVAKFKRHGLLSALRKTGTLVIEPFPIGQSQHATVEIVMTWITLIEKRFKIGVDMRYDMP